MEDILTYLRHAYTSPNMQMEEIECKHLSTENCEMLCLFIGTDSSPFHGKMKGVFQYKDEHIFVFTWHLHRSADACSLTNQMTELQELKMLHSDELNFDYYDLQPTSFGCEAFWKFLKDKEMDTEEARDLRVLMKKMKTYILDKKLIRKE